MGAALPFSRAPVMGLATVPGRGIGPRITVRFWRGCDHSLQIFGRLESPLMVAKIARLPAPERSSRCYRRTETRGGTGCVSGAQASCWWRDRTACPRLDSEPYGDGVVKRTQCLKPGRAERHAARQVRRMGDKIVAVDGDHGGRDWGS